MELDLAIVASIQPSLEVLSAFLAVELYVYEPKVDAFHEISSPVAAQPELLSIEFASVPFQQPLAKLRFKQLLFLLCLWQVVNLNLTRTDCSP